MADTTRRRGFSVRVFLPDGDPEGLKVVEKSNWSGCGLVIPRSLLVEAMGRAELLRAGVYVLVGPSETALPKVYIGQADPVGERLKQHAVKKDFWTHAVVFTSKDQNLNKAHVSRLESRLVELAKAAARCKLDNANVPPSPSLSEADAAEVEGFLDDLLLCLPILGYAFFEQAQKQTPSSSPQFWHRVKGLTARGFEVAGGFTVCQGSQAEKVEAPSIHGFLHDMRQALIASGTFADRGKYYELTQDYVFGSPSTASGVLLGRPSNGRVEWKTSDGRTLKSIQEEQLGA